MRPIDADALINHLEDLRSYTIQGEEHPYYSGETNALSVAIQNIENAPTVDAVPVVRCRDCKYYCVKDFWADFHGTPILAASDVPTCNRWADTESKVDPDGFCFLAEKKVSE